MRSEHGADRIITALEKLHKRFYPEPGYAVTYPEGGEVFVVADTDHMKKAELKELYWKCGDILHRGDIESVKELCDLDFDTIKVAIDKFIGLLKFHRIAFFGSEDELWVIMQAPKTGKVSATLKRPI